jgi:hypothetical protein
MFSLGKRYEVWGVFVGDKIASHHPASVAVFDGRDNAVKFATDLQQHVSDKCTVQRVSICVSRRKNKAKGGA